MYGHTLPIFSTYFRKLSGIITAHWPVKHRLKMIDKVYKTKTADYNICDCEAIHKQKHKIFI